MVEGAVTNVDGSVMSTIWVLLVDLSVAGVFSLDW